MATVSSPPSVVSASPQGLGGWLIVPFVGVVLVALLQIAYFPWILGQFKSGAPWFLEFVIYLGLLAFEAAIFFSCLKRKRITQSLMVAWLSLVFFIAAGGILFSYVMRFLTNQANSHVAYIYPALIIIGCAVGIAYFYRSRRVKATFVS